MFLAAEQLRRERRTARRLMVALPMLKAVIRHENGIQPYRDEQIIDGWRMALA